jgi:hypothetical protein
MLPLAWLHICESFFVLYEPQCPSATDIAKGSASGECLLNVGKWLSIADQGMTVPTLICMPDVSANRDRHDAFGASILLKASLSALT